MKLGSVMVVVALALGIVEARAGAQQDADAAIHRKDYATALNLLEPLARQGEPRAQLALGLLHYHGHGVAESDAQARQWIEQAARKGLPDAQFQLGNMYAYGHADAGPEVDPSRLAAQWYFEAARKGHADAQYSLGILFFTGSGVEQNTAEARKWIGRAAAKGHADARSFMKGQGRRKR